jgi:hypothetical protein
MRIPSRGAWVRAIGLLAASLLGPGCGGGSALQEHVSKEGRYRILLPGQPQEEEDGDVKKVSFTARSGSYAVAYQDLEKEEGKSAEEQLEAACARVEQTLKGRAVRRRKVTLAGRYPGYEVSARWQDGEWLVRHRLYLVEGRLYQVIASGQKWWVESGETDRVFRSFAVLEE